MSLYPILSKREKLLAASAAVLLVVFVVIGYTKASAENLIPTVNTKVIQTDFGTPTEKIDVNIMPTPVTPVVDEKQVDANDCKNQQDNLRNWQRNITDQEGEITRIEKQAKITATDARKYLTAFKSCVATLTACTPDFWNKNNDCNDAQRDLQNELQDNLYPLRDCADRSKNIQDRNREKRNLASQVNDIKRMGAVDLTQLNAYITQITDKVTEGTTLAAGTCTRDTADKLSDIQNDLNTLFQDFYNMSNDLRELASCPQKQKEIDNRRREKANLTSQLRDIENMNEKLADKDKADVSKLKGYISEIDVQLEKASQVKAATCTRETVDILNDVQNALNTSFQDFYNDSNDVRQQADQGRQLADNKRDYEKDKKARCEKDKTREFNNFTKEFNKAKTKGTVTKEDQEAYDNVKVIFDKMCVEDLAAMKAALDIKDVQAYNDARSDYDSLDRDFWDALNESRQGVQEVKQKAEQLKNVTRELKNWTSQLRKMNKEVLKLTASYKRIAAKYVDRTEKKEALAKFADSIKGATELVKKIDDGLKKAREEAPKDPESWWMDHQDELNDLRQDYNDKQQEIQMIGQIMQTLTQVEKEMKSTKKELAQLGSESNNDPVLMGKLNEIFTRANASIAEAWGLISSPEEAMGVLEGMQDFRQEWEDAKQEWRDARDATQEEENW